jgi:hypothetical protein
MVPLSMIEERWEVVVFLAALVLCPVRLVCVAVFWVSTTKEERDLSFLFVGDVIVGTLKAAASVLSGNTLFLIL